MPDETTRNTTLGPIIHPVQRRPRASASAWASALLTLAWVACSDGGSTPEPERPSDAGSVVDAEVPPDDAEAFPEDVPGLASVWAIHDGEKIERDELDSPYEAANRAWEGGTIRLFGARNEVVAFQLIVEADAEGIDELTVSLPSLQHRASDAAIVYAPPAADPTDYAGRPIQIFSQHYMQVTEPTDAYWITEPNRSSSPEDMLGWKPVQLIPENARAGRGGLPLRVEPSSNQGLWFEVYIAEDLPAGLYDGTVTVRVDGVPRAVPIELEVFDFALPDENSMHAMLYYEGEQVDEYQGQSLDAAYHRFAHRHRAEFVHAYDEDALQAHLGRFTGDDFTASEGYEGPGAGVGNTLVPRTFYGPGSDFQPDTARASADQWMAFLRDRLPEAITFAYMPDEPSSGQFSLIQSIAQAVHGSDGPGRELPIFVTRGYTASLAPAIDIWCTIAGFYDQARAEQERSEGDDVWYYNGQRPFVGSNVIDSPATDPRMHAWASFKHGIRVYFYWHVNHWHHNHNAPSEYERVQDVWAEPITFRNQQGAYANGDGVLVYPGQEVLHPEHDRGIAGPISTIQMANLRRGLQDHAYLTLARELGLDAQVHEALDAIVPAVFDDAGAAVGFAQHGDAYEQARYQLAQAIAAAR